MKLLKLLFTIFAFGTVAFAGTGINAGTDTGISNIELWNKLANIDKNFNTINNYGDIYRLEKIKHKHSASSIIPANGFKETAYISLPYKLLIKNIDLLYRMGYLPFYAEIDKKEMESYKITFVWNTKKVPHRLAGLVPVTPDDILYKSAVLRFAKDYRTHVSPSDLAATEFMLKIAQESGFKARKPFVWVYVNQHVPQKIYVWKNGKYIFTSPINTGVRHTTVSGNFMIYARYRAVAMQGYFPGTHEYYYDPDVPWVNFFYKGEAIHGYPRRHYGYPQSAGCVELPVRKAKELYPLLYTYAVVTVSGE